MSTPEEMEVYKACFAKGFVLVSIANIIGLAIRMLRFMRHGRKDPLE